MNLSDFVKENLIGGFENGSFTREQVNIFAANYLLKAIITEADFNDITARTAEPQE